jgi:hypothetical protein
MPYFCQGHFMINQIILAAIAHNVTCRKRRFAGPNKQTVRFAGLANCGGVKRGNGEAMT